MDVIQHMNLAAVDLNLLVVFDALVAEQHVTRAAQKVGLSQPAASSADLCRGFSVEGFTLTLRTFWILSQYALAYQKQ